MYLQNQAVQGIYIVDIIFNAQHIGSNDEFWAGPMDGACFTLIAT